MFGPRTLVAAYNQENSERYYSAVTAGRGEGQVCTSGTKAIELIQSGEFDIIVIDMELEDMRGLSLCQQLRSISDAGIILIGDTDNSFDLIVGLELGADEALRAPVEPRELQARMQALWRRVRVSRNHHESNEQTDQNQALMLDPAHRSVRVDGRPVGLTPNEYRIMAALMEHQGNIVHADDLAMLMKNGNEDGIEARRKQVWIYIGRLRGKIERDARHPRRLLTVRGKGYRIATVNS